MAGDGQGGSEWTDRLLAADLLQPTAQQGLYGRTGRFEEIVWGLERVVGEAGHADRPEIRRFPPVMALETLVRAGYPRSFPDLIGTVNTFEGTDAEHSAMLARLDGDADGDWVASLSPAGTALCSATCHPLYPSISGALPPGGRRFDVYGWVFRREPSPDPARQQAFRMYEHVYVGEPGAAKAHTETWRARALEICRRLEIAVDVVPANDPFFGRAGRLLAQTQQEAGLKFELVAATGPGSPTTAIASTNSHREHFGTAFAITRANGEPAHSACVGFGMERIALALLWAHGLDPSAWPGSVRKVLAL